MDYTIAAVDQALTLLEVVAENQSIGLSELARKTGFTKTLAFRMASTLEARGYLIKDPAERTYSLGYKPLYLSEWLQRGSLLVRVAGPYLDDLLARTRENVSLFVRDGLATQCIAIRQSPQPIRLHAELGGRSPLHVGGGPKLLLAHAPQEVQDQVLSGELTAFTPTTIVDPKRLKTLMSRIRRQGYNVSYGEIDPGAFSVAAPIRDHGGQVIAALTVAGPQSRLNRDLEALYIRVLQETAAEISAQLGWSEHPSLASEASETA
jgi:IclR family transcriptional regulator, KDG regulon repressor